MLDYKDITLISRHISEIKSRDDISISSSLFGESRRPIIASPMKDVCNGEVARIMTNEGCQGIVHRFMDIEQQCIEATYNGVKNPICAIGINGDYLDRYKRLIKSNVKRFCIDVANSSSVYVKNTVKELLEINPDSRFIVGNAVSIEGINYYNDIPEVEAIRVGVGGGCFVSGTLVKTIDCYKKIENIKVNDLVLTHDGSYKKVEATLTRKEDERICQINNIECTTNHEFYVLNKKFESLVNEDNIQEYAEWVKAEDLSEDYLLIEITE